MFTVNYEGYVLNKACDDKEWSSIIKSKNDGCCVICNSPYVTPAHIISRRFYVTRLLIDNGVPLCVSCHNNFDSLNPLEHDKYAKLLIGDVYTVLKRIQDHKKEVNKWQ